MVGLNYGSDAYAQSSSTQTITDSLMVYVVQTQRDLYYVPGFVDYVAARISRSDLEGYHSGSLTFSDGTSQNTQTANSTGGYTYYMKYYYSHRENGGRVMAVILQALTHYGITYSSATAKQYIYAN